MDECIYSSKFEVQSLFMTSCGKWKTYMYSKGEGSKMSYRHIHTKHVESDPQGEQLKCRFTAGLMDKTGPGQKGSRFP